MSSETFEDLCDAEERIRRLRFALQEAADGRIPDPGYHGSWQSWAKSVLSDDLELHARQRTMITQG